MDAAASVVLPMVVVVVKYLLSQGIVFAPHSNELGQMVTTQNGAVPCEVIETVHDDGDHDVQHDKAAQENEGDEVEVGDVGSARLVRVHGEAGGLVDLNGELVTNLAADARHHDFGPSFACGTSEENHESLENGAKVGVSLNGSVGVKVDVAKQLHADDGVDEEQHHHQHHDVWQGLKKDAEYIMLVTKFRN